MKILIEVSGGVVACITATQEASIYLIDHDNLKARQEETLNVTTDARAPLQPDCITWEEGEEATPEFDRMLDEALEEYEKKTDQPENKEYRVKWEIDITAGSPMEAAKKALEIQRDRGSIALYFEVKDEQQKNWRIVDLLEGKEAPAHG